MKALTLWQPWASLVALGVKRIETRSWSTDYRGPLAIHAGTKRPSTDGSVGGWWPHQDPDLGWHAYHMGADRQILLPLGAIVATARLVDVVPITSRNAGEPDPGNGAYVIPYADGVLGLVPPWRGVADFSITDQRPYGDFAPGRFAWLLEGVEPVDPPIPAKGHQRLWNWDER